MEENPVPIQEQTKDKTKQRKAIDCEIKTRLIFSVVNDRLPIYQVMKNFNDLLFQAAILHKVKYSSAKHILRNYFNDSANFFDIKKEEEKNTLHQCIYINRSMFWKNHNKETIIEFHVFCQQWTDFRVVTKDFKLTFLCNMSRSLAASKEDRQKAIRRIGKIQQDLDKLYSIIKRQHNEMTNLKELY